MRRPARRRAVSTSCLASSTLCFNRRACKALPQRHACKAPLPSLRQATQRARRTRARATSSARHACGAWRMASVRAVSTVHCVAASCLAWRRPCRPSDRLQTQVSRPACRAASLPAVGWRLASRCRAPALAATASASTETVSPSSTRRSTIGSRRELRSGSARLPRRRGSARCSSRRSLRHLRSLGSAERAADATLPHLRHTIKSRAEGAHWGVRSLPSCTWPCRHAGGDRMRD